MKSGAHKIPHQRLCNAQCAYPRFQYNRIHPNHPSIKQCIIQSIQSIHPSIHQSIHRSLDPIHTCMISPGTQLSSANSTVLAAVSVRPTPAAVIPSIATCRQRYQQWLCTRRRAANIRAAAAAALYMTPSGQLLEPSSVPCKYPHCTRAPLSAPTTCVPTSS